jgi:hypothetical protein
MSVVLDSLTLNVITWTENQGAVHTQWDAWRLNNYKRNIQQYGYIRQIVLAGVEQGVTWANSVVNHFQGVLSAGTSITLMSTLAVRSLSTTVKVLGVDFKADKIGSQNIRYYSLSLQET